MHFITRLSWVNCVSGLFNVFSQADFKVMMMMMMMMIFIYFVYSKHSRGHTTSWLTNCSD